MQDGKDRIAFVHLGCAKNLVDAEVMAGHLREAGYEIASGTECADVVIVNTCGFISDAREEAVDAILAAVEPGEDGRIPAVIAAGCLAQRYPEQLREGIPELAGIIGVNDIHQISGVVAGALAGGHPLRVSNDVEAAGGPGKRFRWTPRHYRYLKIAEGCDRRCNYCAIPLIRGPYRSRPAAEILREAAALVDDGARELNLVAQDVTRYRDPATGMGLNELLGSLAEAFVDTWIRILYAHPAGIDESLVETILRHDNIAPYLDVPLQHASPRILAAMGRPEDPERVRDFLTRLRRNHPQFSLRSTFLVGFPGETEADFELLLDRVAALQLDDAAVFPFSPEEGTPAHSLPGVVPGGVARDRANQLGEVIERASFEAKQRFVGRMLSVVLDKYRDEVWMGRHPGQAPEIDGAVIIPGVDEGVKGLEPGVRLEVEIEAADSIDLWGRIRRKLV